MFEDNTYDAIMDEMLSQVDESVDTRQGSIVHETLAPMAMENAQMYADMGLILDECFADSASYYYLIKRAAERGIIVEEGTPAVLKILVSPTDVSMDLGTEFTIGELAYTVTENLGSGYYNITCEESGVEGNNTTDEIIPSEDIEDLESVEIVEIVEAGTDDEEVETLRERYFDSFTDVAFGGNKSDYKERADSYEDVYGTKVYPVWNGGGTVKLKILGADYRAASASVISDIQEAFDPTQDGTGVGIAPIGHIVTVDTATEDSIDVDMTISYISPTTWSDISATFQEEFEQYLLDLRKDWEDEDNLIVRSGEIERIVLGIDGVDDISSVLINNASGNYTVASDSVPIGGDYSG